MGRTLVALVLSWALGGLALAAEPVATVNLWPGIPPGDTKDLGPEKIVRGMLTNVSKPSVSVYKPQKQKDTHVAIIVAPGGGFTGLAMAHEGTQVCDWLNSIGVTGVLLKYRVPNRQGMPRYM